MPATDLMPDTCAWVDFFRGRKTHLAAAVEQALLNGSIVTCGVVLYELTQGIKSPAEQAVMQSAFRAVPMLEFSGDQWCEAGRLAATLRAQGQTLPMSDILIAVLAMHHGATVLTEDRHFSTIPGLTVKTGKTARHHQ